MKLRFCLKMFALLFANCVAAPFDVSDSTNESDGHIRVARNVIIDPARRWPNNTICYRFNPGFNESQRALVRDAMDYIENLTYVRFNEDTIGRRDCVTIKPADPSRACTSNVGYLGKPQNIILPNIEPNTGCFTKFKIVHELLHTCGMYHQQSAHNRDEYVEIQWENVAPEKMRAFAQHSPDESTSFCYPYDFDSVMHYGPTTGSKNGKPVIVALQGEEFGQRTHMSEIDVLKMKAMYPRIEGSDCDCYCDFNCVCVWC